MPLPLPLPLLLRTARLLLRPWRPDDAVLLLPVLEANRAHLGPWIPARVAKPEPIPDLRERLAGFLADFTEARGWRYGLFTPDETRVLGEVSLFPRAGEGRVAYREADHGEIGYWLRADETGHGFVTEAAQAVLTLAAGLPSLRRVEIRCDARNGASIAVAQRLGFVHATTVESPSVVPAEPAVALQVWTYALVGGAAERR